MAVTLPYPDMDFVPLDILTAAEQNQLVANIEYLAGVFPLSAANIDFSTFNMITACNSNSGTQDIGAQANIVVNSYTIKSGNGLSVSSEGVVVGQGVSKVLVSANVFYDSGTSSTYGWYHLTKNGVEIPYTTTLASVSGGYGSAVCSPLLVNVSTGDVIRMRNISAGAEIRNNSTWMTVVAAG